MVHFSFASLNPECFEDIQEFSEKYMTMRNMCDELDQRFGRCEDDIIGRLEDKSEMDPIDNEPKETMGEVEAKHHTITIMSYALCKISLGSP